ncbi:division plane positioning ATPase MipZ [Vibrio penaeicida]|uniref:division plane positioning ATPase MipZ n=1 Tax=Vibrio penaeicida TaxID=104609 RepID=UPI001CC3E19F|nr:division plane positioning ATPase MipZ [Vibrio penaeicida]
MTISLAVGSPKGGVGKSTAAQQLASIIKGSFLIAHDSTSNFSFINKVRAEWAEKKNIKPVKAPIFESFERKKNEDGSIEIMDNFETYNNFIQENKVSAVYDLGGYDSPDHRFIYSIVDHIIIPIGLSEYDLQSLETMNDTLIQASKTATQIKIKLLEKELHRELTKEEAKQADTKLVGKVLACRIHPNSTKTSPRFLNLVERVAEFDHLELLDSVIYELSDYVKASNKGFSVLELPQTKHSRAARDVKALASELNLLSAQGE